MLTGFDCHGRSCLPKSEMLSRMKRGHSLVGTVYIGDGAAGDEAAAELAGIAHIHVAWGFGQPKGYRVIVGSFAELLACLVRARPSRQARPCQVFLAIPAFAAGLLVMRQAFGRYKECALHRKATYSCEQPERLRGCRRRKDR